MQSSRGYQKQSTLSVPAKDQETDQAPNNVFNTNSVLAAMRKESGDPINLELKDKRQKDPAL